jgi:hypothetical protein
VVLEHSMFCGKDTGYTIHAHPARVAKMLPAPVELSWAERVVLCATRSFKSSYNGRNRFQLVLDDGVQISSAQWNEAKSALITRKLLRGNGAITPAGRNAINGVQLHQLAR